MNQVDDLNELLHLKQRENTLLKRLKISDHGYRTTSNTLITETITELMDLKRRNATYLSNMDILTHVFGFLPVFPSCELDMLIWYNMLHVNSIWRDGVIRVLRGLYLPYRQTLSFDICLFTEMDVSRIELLTANDLGVIERFLRLHLLITNKDPHFKLGKAEKIAKTYFTHWTSLKSMCVKYPSYWEWFDGINPPVPFYRKLNVNGIKLYLGIETLGTFVEVYESQINSVPPLHSELKGRCPFLEDKLKYREYKNIARKDVVVDATRDSSGILYNRNDVEIEEFKPRSNPDRVQDRVDETWTGTRRTVSPPVIKSRKKKAPPIRIL
jgi:hypothetical protein